jgi:hypothetical protein
MEEITYTTFRYRLASGWGGWLKGSYGSRRGRVTRATIRRRLVASWRNARERVTVIELL